MCCPPYNLHTQVEEEVKAVFNCLCIFENFVEVRN
jgi:hypothetical protein